MKKINEIQVKMTFTVNICDVKVSKEIYNQLNYICDNCINVNCLDFSHNFEEAKEWLMENISSDDADEASYEVETIE